MAEYIKWSKVAEFLEHEELQLKAMDDMVAARTASRYLEFVNSLERINIGIDTEEVPTNGLSYD